MDELNMKQPAPVMGSPAPKPELPAHHVSKTTKILMLVFAVILLGALGYLVWYQNTTSDTSEETTVTTKKTTGSTSTTTGTGTTATTTTEERVYADAAKTYSIVLPSGFATMATPVYTDLLPITKERLDSFAQTISFNLNKTVTGIAHTEYFSRNLPLATGFSGSAEKLTHVISIREFNFKAKAGDTLPAGQDSGPLGTVKTLAALPNGYYTLTAESLNAMSNCTTSTNASWIPLSNTSTLVLTVFECNETRIAANVTEGQNSRPVTAEARTALDKIQTDIVNSFKLGK